MTWHDCMRKILTSTVTQQSDSLHLPLQGRASAAGFGECKLGSSGRTAKAACHLAIIVIIIIIIIIIINQINVAGTCVAGTRTETASRWAARHAIGEQHCTCMSMMDVKLATAVKHQTKWSTVLSCAEQAAEIFCAAYRDMSICSLTNLQYLVTGSSA